MRHRLLCRICRNTYGLRWRVSPQPPKEIRQTQSRHSKLCVLVSSQACARTMQQSRTCTTFFCDVAGTETPNRLGQSHHVHAARDLECYANPFGPWRSTENEFKFHPAAGCPMPSYAALQGFCGASLWRGLPQQLSLTEHRCRQQCPSAAIYVSGEHLR
jgi:hypothetical protein